MDFFLVVINQMVFLVVDFNPMVFLVMVFNQKDFLVALKTHFFSNFGQVEQLMVLIINDNMIYFFYFFLLESFTLCYYTLIILIKDCFFAPYDLWTLMSSSYDRTMYIFLVVHWVRPLTNLVSELITTSHPCTCSSSFPKSLLWELHLLPCTFHLQLVFRPFG